MSWDADSPLQLGFLIRFVEPNLKPEEIEVEAQYLREDLLDLSGMEHTRLQFLMGQRHQVQFREGVRFEAAPDRLGAILTRLCDRLDDNPLETLVLIYYNQVRLQLQTHRSEELAGIYAPAEALLPPQSIYLAKAETYVRTRGELSPAERENLELLATRLGLEPEKAETLRVKAMGPFKTLQEKRQRFQQVMTNELSHDYPPSEETRRILYELAENLRLPPKDADDLYRDYMQKIQTDAEARRQKEEAEADAARQKAAALDQLEHDQHDQVERHQQVDQYRNLFSRAIQNQLYPLAFDQGRLEQTRQIWAISRETAQQIEAEVRSERYGSIQSAVGIDYTRLRQLLWSQAWREADVETENVILKALSQDMEPLDRDAAMRLPCVDLLTIDQLWNRYSDGNFGFQAQYQIFEDAERRPLDFQRLVEWRHGSFNLRGEMKPYSALDFNLSAPKGHLPTWRWCCASLEGGYEVSDAVIEGFFLHLAKCLSLNLNATAPAAWETSPET